MEKKETKNTQTIEMNNEMLNFEEAKVQTLNIGQLKRTHMENDIMGRPLKGIYHWEVIEAVRDIAMSHGLKAQIEEIFAAQNRDRTQPGVVLLPEVEKRYGQKAVEAHVLRRVFANIRLTDWDTDEFTANVAVAFHQDGIQIGFGTMVKACHNQCIMNADRYMQSYGKDKMDMNAMTARLNEWMADAGKVLSEEQEKILKMKNVKLTNEMLMRMIGELTALRVAHDTVIKEIQIKGTYPLSQTQINTFTEAALVKQREEGEMTLWDAYNLATELYKADRMEIPNILPQNAAMTEYLERF